MTALLQIAPGNRLGRSVSLDPSVPGPVILGRAAAVALGICRGFLFARRKIYLGRGARISDVKKLTTSGGLVRIEDHARIECTSHEGVSLGRSFKLGAFSRIIASGTLSDLGQGVRIGDDVGIGEFAYIGGAGGVTIGSGTIVGQYFSVHPENHVFDDPDQPIRDQGVTRQGISVGSECWIGAKVTLLDGASVGDHCVIAAGSVVNASFPDNSVIGGVPARLLKTRTRSTDQNPARKSST
jgi:acetyltransferase-like isoleucine patch superfamily enzyme